MLPALVYNKFGRGGDQMIPLSNIRPFRAVIELMAANFLPQSRSYMLQCALEYFAQNPRKLIQAIAFFDQWATRNKSNKIGRATGASISAEASQAFYDFQQYGNLTRDELVSVLWVACCHENMFSGIHKIAAARAGDRLRVRSDYKLQMVVSTYREPALAGVGARKARR
jgi:hypothetical protein